MDSLDEYEELATFGNIKYTPAWYYRQYPGFYNIECYKVLAKHAFQQQQQPLEEEPVMEVEEEPVMGTEEQKNTEEEMQPSAEPTQENKKRSYEEVETIFEISI